MHWALISGMYNVADLVTEFCTYYLGLGVDRIFVAEYGSDDGTVDLLQPFVRAGQVEIVPLLTQHFAKYDPSNAILSTIRERKGADWISFLDPDEFLVGPDQLRDFLREALRGREAIAIPRFNLTGIGPVPPQTHYLSHLTFKITKSDPRVSNAAATLSSPWIFSRLPPKVMINVTSSLTTTTGDHDVRGSGAPLLMEPSCQILHLPIRSYQAFQEKIECGINYYAQNPELGPGIGWHWRRWIALFEKGQLHKEYERQFLDRSLAESFIAKGDIVRETRLADWLPQQFAN